MTSRWYAAIAAALVTFGIAACGAEAPKDAVTPDASGESSPAPSDEPVELTIDGAEYPVEGEVMCSDHAGGFAMHVGDDPNDVFVTLNVGGSAGVDSVSFGGGFVGVPLKYYGNDTGSDLTSDGDSRVITGQATEDLAYTPNPSGRTWDFHLRITCP